MEFDIWLSDDGNVTSAAAVKPIVDDNDAPYGFHRHAIRLSASSRRDALNQYRKLLKQQ